MNSPELSTRIVHMVAATRAARIATILAYPDRQHGPEQKAHLIMAERGAEQCATLLDVPPPAGIVGVWANVLESAQAALDYMPYVLTPEKGFDVIVAVAVETYTRKDYDFFDGTYLGESTWDCLILHGAAGETARWPVMHRDIAIAVKMALGL